MEVLPPPITFSQMKTMLAEDEKQLKETGKTENPYLDEWRTILAQSQDYKDDDFVSYDYRNYEGLGDNVYIWFGGTPYLDSTYFKLPRVSNADDLTNNSSDVPITMQYVVYQLFDHYEMPVQYGEVLEDDHDVVLSKNAAELMRKGLQVSSVEDLIGMKIDIQLDQYSPYEKYGQDFLSKSEVAATLTIKGIAYNGNEDNQFQTYQVFMKEGAWDKILADFYRMDDKNFMYDGLELIMADDANIPATISDVQTLLDSKESHFLTKKDSGIMEHKEAYQNASTFYMLALLLGSGLLLLYISYDIIKYRRDKKEQALLERYGYRVFLTTLLKLLFVFLIVLIIQGILLSPISSILNGIANSLAYAYLINHQFSMYLWSFMISIFCITSIEIIFTMIKRK